MKQKWPKADSKLILKGLKINQNGLKINQKGPKSLIVIMVGQYIVCCSWLQWKGHRVASKKWRLTETLSPLCSMKKMSHGVCKQFQFFRLGETLCKLASATLQLNFNTHRSWNKTHCDESLYFFPKNIQNWQSLFKM